MEKEEDGSTFGTRAFWEQWYKNQLEEEQSPTVEWYLGYTQMKEYLQPLLSKDDRIIIVGCGNSIFPGTLSICCHSL
jgi:hypothetical protein